MTQPTTTSPATQSTPATDAAYIAALGRIATALESLTQNIAEACTAIDQAIAEINTAGSTMSAPLGRLATALEAILKKS